MVYSYEDGVFYYAHLSFFVTPAVVELRSRSNLIYHLRNHICQKACHRLPSVVFMAPRRMKFYMKLNPSKKILSVLRASFLMSLCTFVVSLKKIRSKSLRRTYMEITCECCYWICFAQRKFGIVQTLTLEESWFVHGIIRKHIIQHSAFELKEKCNFGGKWEVVPLNQENSILNSQSLPFFWCPVSRRVSNVFLECFEYSTLAKFPSTESSEAEKSG